MEHQWQLKEKDIKTQEFQRCTEYMQIEKNDLRRQMQELESKYQK